MSLLERFLRYVQIDTQSDANSPSAPSTAKQFDLLNLLAKELGDLGITAEVDQTGVVYATIPSNLTYKVPTVGFVAHVDTASELTGANVKPRVITNYQGQDIRLHPDHDYILSPTDFPRLNTAIGKDLVVTNGLTLLGADDKAGVAEVMTLAETLMKHPNIPHGDVKIAFTPDEEIGRGTANFDVKRFDAQFAYTLDGDQVGVIEFENFNAALAVVEFFGTAIHPGSAKGRMINAVHLAMDFHRMLPVQLDPALTSGYEGFNHLKDIEGNVDHVKMEYIIRNHDATLLEKQKEDFQIAAQSMNAMYRKEVVRVTLRDQYRNMRSLIEPQFYIVELAVKATEAVGLTSSFKAIRGGTDGANLTYMGLPCPNLGTGGYNYHGRFEYAVVQEMEQAAAIALEIVKLTAQLPLK